MLTEGYCVFTVMKPAVFVWVPVAMITHPDKSKLGGKKVTAAEA